MSTKPKISPKGLATGIGSLPHATPEAAVKSLLAHMKTTLFWPQLPKRSPLEGMTPQYLINFPGILEDGDKVRVDAEKAGQELGGFYEKVWAGDLEYFALPADRAHGFFRFVEDLKGGIPKGIKYLKGHVTGPVTMASSLKDTEGRELTHNPSLREAVAEMLAMNARWQVRKLKAFGLPVIIFLDEPVMEVYGSAYSSLTEEIALSLFRPVLDAIDEEGAYSGIHCCGNTDWALLFKSGVDIVNFDAYGYMEKLALYAGEAQAFLAGGGMLAWGIVPTDARSQSETAEGLYARLKEGIELLASRGVDKKLLQSQCIITPSCGMGGLEVELAEKIMTMLNDVSRLFTNEFWPEA